jgi:hypothetical protein
MGDFHRTSNAALAGALFFALACAAASCTSDDPSPPSSVLTRNAESLTWVAIEPTQCLTNAWEQDWLARNGDDYAGYPRDPGTPGLEAGEIAIIEEYYSRRGVVVSGTDTAPKYEAVCLACSCPEGHTMFLRVRAQDVNTMIGLGYRVEAPPPRK